MIQEVSAQLIAVRNAGLDWSAMNDIMIPAFLETLLSNKKQPVDPSWVQQCMTEIAGRCDTRDRTWYFTVVIVQDYQWMCSDFVFEVLLLAFTSAKIYFFCAFANLC